MSNATFMERRRIFSLLLATAVSAAALWLYAFQPRVVHRAPDVVTLQDGKTIDFSGGTAREVGTAPLTRPQWTRR